MLFFLLQIPPPTSTPPTHDTLIPWIIAFLASSISGIIWYILRELRQEIKDQRVSMENRLKRNDEAIDRAAESNLMLVVSFPQTSDFTRSKSEAIQKDIDEARRDRNQT